MNRTDQIEFLIEILLNELPELRESASKVSDRRRLLRALMNVRPPAPLTAKFITIQDQLLRAETIERGIVELAQLPPIERINNRIDESSDARSNDRVNDRIRLWQGDITRLKVDAIVNAANDQLLGCFVPCHGCIDNAIHSAAGLQLRQACYEIMSAQGYAEPTGRAKLTPAFNLPSKYVIHTVGPIVRERLTVAHEKLLADCYRSCLELAVEHGLESLAFCCISTGEFGFPNEPAARIAIDTVKNFIDKVDSSPIVVFNVFKDFDLTIYKNILGGL